jgi:hypothetical protein
MLYLHTSTSMYYSCINNNSTASSSGNPGWGLLAIAFDRLSDVETLLVISAFGWLSWLRGGT